MTKTKKLLVGYTALCAVTVMAACTGGTGSPASVLLGYENKKGDFAAPTEDGQDDPPGSSGGQQKGGQTQNPTPNENPTPQPTGTTTGTSQPANCPPCDGKYTCKTGTETREFDLQQRSGACTEVNSGAVLACGGKVTAGGQDVGQWASSGGQIAVKVGATTYLCSKGTTPTPVDGGTISDGGSKG